MKKVIWISSLAILPLVAQPVYTADDLPEPGYEATFTADTTKDLIVDVGSTGGPQEWDYSRTLEGPEITFNVTSPAGTPAGDSFPDADICYYMDDMPNPSGEMDADVESWQYFKIEEDGMYTDGEYRNVVSDTFDITQYKDYDPDIINTPLPMQMGASWHTETYTMDTLDENGLITLEMWRYNSNEADAWGTISVPNDNYQTLRYITYDTVVTKFNFIVPGEPDTSTSINYTWVTANAGPVMMISSKDWEENPDFDTAGFYAALTANNLPGIEEEDIEKLPNNVRLSGSELLFTLTRPGYVSIEIFDAAGRKEVVILDGILPSGKHSMALPGALSEGVHFVRFMTPAFSKGLKFVKTH
ncbi:hypothetical protein GF359_03710 [candidate division WOR-3 bacterium]|uniref:T9SS type A sorting domain-containing protein n=1 Tax=candidate division WOR-3 bacterium TaxID=2052148 RepID=A0A9D5QCQ6_UNCW3|nr:hypothetical protein [candidate division WOR-3 bacterium]MBD3364302.1 hypothetical protein [candidate division WOR-3 bacterium]